MHAVVLLKRVLDPEIPQSAFAVDPERREPLVPRAPYVLSVFDGNALEVALRLRDALGGACELTALSFGPQAAEEVLRKALALQCDRAVLVSGEEQGLGARRKADILAAAIRRLPPADLVLLGRQAADWEAGQLGGMLAESLGVPCLPFVSEVRRDGDAFQAVQQLEGGTAVYRLPGPAVLTVTNAGGNVLRPARIRDVMAARGREIAVVALGELAMGDGGTAEVETTALRLPTPRGKAEMIDGATAGERARSLVRRLGELGAI